MIIFVREFLEQEPISIIRVQESSSFVIGHYFAHDFHCFLMSLFLLLFVVFCMVFGDFHFFFRRSGSCKLCRGLSMYCSIMLLHG